MSRQQTGRDGRTYPWCYRERQTIVRARLRVVKRRASLEFGAQCTRTIMMRVGICGIVELSPVVACVLLLAPWRYNCGFSAHIRPWVTESRLRQGPRALHLSHGRRRRPLSKFAHSQVSYSISTVTNRSTPRPCSTTFTRSWTQSGMAIHLGVLRCLCNHFLQAPTSRVSGKPCAGSGTRLSKSSARRGALRAAQPRFCSG